MSNFGWGFGSYPDPKKLVLSITNIFPKLYKSWDCALTNLIGQDLKAGPSFPSFPNNHQPPHHIDLSVPEPAIRPG